MTNILDIVREDELETEVRGIPVNTEGEESVPAAFVSAAPPRGEIAANRTITVTFDNNPGDVTVSAGEGVTGAGKTRTIAGPFTPGALSLTVSWTNGDGSHTLTYNVTRARYRSTHCHWWNHQRWCRRC